MVVKSLFLCLKSENFGTVNECAKALSPIAENENVRKVAEEAPEIVALLFALVGIIFLRSNIFLRCFLKPQLLLRLLNPP